MALPFEQHALAELGKSAPNAAPINPSEQWARLKGQEHDQIQTLIERDEKSGTLNPEQAAEYHALNDRGRLLLYGVGGEFDDYLSRDEFTANLTDETRTTTITLFNPAWGDGKAEVTLGELSQAFDRKEAVALVDTLRAEHSLEIEGLEWDPEHRKVFAAVKNAEGKFRVEMDLDDGAHSAPKYHVTDKNGEIAEIGKEDLSHLGKPPYQPVPGLAAATAATAAAAIAAAQTAAAVPEGRANNLNQKFTTMAKFKKQFFREGGVPERAYQAPRPVERKREQPVLPKKGPMPSQPTTGGGGAEDMVRQAHHDTSAQVQPGTSRQGQQPAIQPAPQPVPIPQPEPQRPNRFAGLPMPGRRKGPSLWPALAAGGATGGTIIGAASGTGLFTLLFSKHEETTAFVNTTASFLQTFFA